VPVPPVPVPKEVIKVPAANPVPDRVSPTFNDVVPVTEVTMRTFPEMSPEPLKQFLKSVSLEH
jgi:hypothetical protein